MVSFSTVNRICLLYTSKNREGSAETDADSLVVYSPHPLDFINPIVSEFEAQTGISVQVRTGGTGELLKWAREGDEPVCDVFWGGSLYAAGAGKDPVSYTHLDVYKRQI